MEKEVQELRKKVAELEQKLSVNTKSDQWLSAVPEPKSLKKQTYEYVEGWKIVDMKIINEALEIAQKCGHSQIVLVEANRGRMRSDLSAHLAYVCITCGRQTLFSTSSYCHEEPANYVVNKQFSALGKSAFEYLADIVQDDKTVLAVPQDKKISDKRPFFLFKFEEDAAATESEEVDPLEEIVIPSEIKSEPGLGIKEEPEDYLEDYLEPSISLTEGDTENDVDDDGVTVKIEDNENIGDPSGPQIDVSTITTNTPVLALATVIPDTEVMGGKVTPWPPHLLITVHPTLFIRTTCSKILLPPALYKYNRNNGLKSIMSVKADSGSFDDIESHYHMTQMTDEMGKSKVKKMLKVDNIRWNTKVKKTYTSAHRKTPLQIYSQDCKMFLANAKVPKEDWDKHIIDMWARLPADEKAEYNDRALNPGGKPSEPEKPAVKGEKKKTTNIPLPALKKFASEVAPELKKKKPYLAKIENRGQLNKHILERWMLLSPAEQDSYKLLAGMSLETPPSPQQESKTQNSESPKPSQGVSKVKKKDNEDSDEEYQPRPSKKRKPV